MVVVGEREIGLGVGRIGDWISYGARLLGPWWTADAPQSPILHTKQQTYILTVVSGAVVSRNSVIRMGFTVKRQPVMTAVPPARM